MPNQNHPIAVADDPAGACQAGEQPLVKSTSLQKASRGTQGVGPWPKAPAIPGEHSTSTQC
eukprot:2132101-Pyramimonas_sp.AAC.1